MIVFLAFHTKKNKKHKGNMVLERDGPKKKGTES